MIIEANKEKATNIYIAKKREERQNVGVPMIILSA